MPTPTANDPNGKSSGPSNGTANVPSTVKRSAKQHSQDSELRSRPSQCRPTTGYFPAINRDVLAKRVGCSASFISYIFKGRSEPKLELGMKIAREIGITFEAFNEVLIKARKEYRRAKDGGVPAGKIVTGKKS